MSATPVTDITTFLPIDELINHINDCNLIIYLFELLKVQLGWETKHAKADLDQHHYYNKVSHNFSECKNTILK